MWDTARTALASDVCRCGRTFATWPLRRAHNRLFSACRYTPEEARARRLQRQPHVVRIPWPDRFWDRVVRSDGCWEWEGTHSPSGYSRVSFQGRQLQAHRVAYELTLGPVPAGLDLDHLCRNRGCVNPGHLEVVAQFAGVRP